MTTTKYKMSYIKKIIFYKKKLLIFLIIILASVPAFRYLGINISATIFSYLLGIERSDLHSPSTPRLELAERVRCGLADPQISMPSYDFWLSKKDFSNLDIPAKTNEKGEFLQRDLVRASVRLREPGDQLGKFGAVRVRKRGFQQSAPNKPFPLKVEMLNNDPSPFRLSHLLYFGMVGAKDTRWWPFHMWVARRLGLITPENRLVRVAVDGKKWGVFWQFEHWGGRTLKTNGIFGGEIYAESDETLPVVSPYLWENIDNWKKYDMHNVPGEGREDYFELDEFLKIVNHPIDEYFNDEIFNYLDFNSAVLWAIHMAIMDSYHQVNYQNARILLNSTTGKFHLIPWDAIPGMFDRLSVGQLDQMPTYHVLLTRLLVNPEFQRAYSQKLFNVVDTIKPVLEQVFEDIYLAPGVSCGVLEDPFFKPSVKARRWTAGSAYSSLNGLKATVLEPRWPDTVKSMLSHVKSSLQILTGLMGKSRLVVSRDVQPASGSGEKTGQSYNATFRYNGQFASYLDSVVLPIETGMKDGESVKAVIRLNAIPYSLAYSLAQTANRSLPIRQERSIVGIVQDGRVVLDVEGLLLMPSYPGKVTTNYRGDVLFQEYKISISFSNRLSIDYNKVEFTFTNGATRKPIEPEFRNVRTKYTRSIAGDIKKLEVFAGKHSWLKFNPTTQSLMITSNNITVDETLIVPRGVRTIIPKDTHFTIAPNAYLAFWGPVEFNGTQGEPIVISAVNSKPWGGLLILDESDIESRVENVIIKGANGGTAFGIKLRGLIHVLSPNAVISGNKCIDSSLNCLFDINNTGSQ